MAGYGEGELVLTPEGETALETDMDLAMAAAGLKGTVLDGGGDGPALALEADGLAVRATSDAVPGLVAADAVVTRLRLGVEGSWQGLSFGGGTLTPSLEVGIRHDGGDAERGFGADIGDGLAWSDPVRGIEAEFKGRGLPDVAERDDIDFQPAQRSPVASCILQELVRLGEPERLLPAAQAVVEDDGGDLASLATAGAVAQHPAPAEPQEVHGGVPHADREARRPRPAAAACGPGEARPDAAHQGGGRP